MCLSLSHSLILLAGAAPFAVLPSRSDKPVFATDGTDGARSPTRSRTKDPAPPRAGFFVSWKDNERREDAIVS